MIRVRLDDPAAVAGSDRLMDPAAYRSLLEAD